jgi:hypothetical protein
MVAVVVVSMTANPHLAELLAQAVVAVVLLLMVVVLVPQVRQIKVVQVEMEQALQVIMLAVAVVVQAQLVLTRLLVALHKQEMVVMV